MFINVIKLIADSIKAAQSKKVKDQLTEEAIKLYNILEESVAIQEYQKGFNPDNLKEPRKYSNGRLVTYCNLLARDLLDSSCPKVWAFGWHIGGENAQIASQNGYNYDISAINPEGTIVDVLLSTNIPTCYKNLLKAAQENKIELLTPEQAQIEANKGIPIHIVSAKYNHEAIVCPDTNNYDSEKGPKIGQAGYYNGIFYISDLEAWYTNWSDPEIIYVKYPVR